MTPSGIEPIKLKFFTEITYRSTFYVDQRVQWSECGSRNMSLCKA